MTVQFNVDKISLEIFNDIVLIRKFLIVSCYFRKCAPFWRNMTMVYKILLHILLHISARWDTVPCVSLTAPSKAGSNDGEDFLPSDIALQLITDIG